MQPDLVVVRRLRDGHQMSLGFLWCGVLETRFETLVQSIGATRATLLV